MPSHSVISAAVQSPASVGAIAVRPRLLIRTSLFLPTRTPRKRPHWRKTEALNLSFCGWPFPVPAPSHGESHHQSLPAFAVPLQRIPLRVHATVPCRRPRGSTTIRDQIAQFSNDQTLNSCLQYTANYLLI